MIGWWCAGWLWRLSSVNTPWKGYHLGICSSISPNFTPTSRFFVLSPNMPWISCKVSWAPGPPCPWATWCLNPHKSKEGGCHRQSLNLSGRLSIDESPPHGGAEKNYPLGICLDPFTHYGSFLVTLIQLGLMFHGGYIFFNLRVFRIPEIKKKESIMNIFEPPPFLESSDWSLGALGPHVPLRSWYISQRTFLSRREML